MTDTSVESKPYADMTQVDWARLDATDATRIHDAAFAQAQLVTYFKTFAKTPMLIVQPEFLPRLSVFELRESEISDGRAGEPHFHTTLELGFVGSIVQSDVDSQLRKLRLALATVRSLLLRDPIFADKQGIESFDSTDTRLTFQKVGETPLCEVSFTMIVGYRTFYPPYLPNELQVIHVEVEKADKTPLLSPTGEPLIQRDYPQNED